MKDIRPLLKEVREILEENESLESVCKNVERLREELSDVKLLQSNRWDLGYVLDDGKYYIEHELGSPEEFEKARLEFIEGIDTLLQPDWPDSFDYLSVTYSRPDSAFGLRVQIQISGVYVSCSELDLKKEVEKAISKLNQNQSAHNFLLNAVYILPTTYKEYKLIL
jgi:hypothetical protein